MEEKNIKTRLQTFVSYYKWYILIALFFVAVIGIMLAQMLTKDEYDITLMYAGNAIFGDKQSADMENAVAGLGKEGEKALLYELVIMNDEELEKAYESGLSSTGINSSTIRKNRENLAINVMSDQYFILLLSPDCYATMQGNGTLEKISELGVDLSGADMHSEYAIRFKSLAFAKRYTAFSVLPDDTLLCFKRISDFGAAKKDKQEKREHDIGIFKRMVEYKVGALGAAQTLFVPDKREEV
jgi:hypothetical protein